MRSKDLRLLVVEDDPAQARLLRETLLGTGSAAFDIVCARRLGEALTLLREGGFDVVLLDLGLPDSQGIDTFLQTRNQAPDLPIVVLTGLDDEAVAMGVVQQGAQDYLTKGTVDSRVLVRAVRYALERQRLTKELVESVARQRQAEDALQKNQTRHLWQALFRTLGRGASAILYRAGTEAGSSTYDFIKRRWSPAGDEAFVKAFMEYCEATSLCNVEYFELDRTTSSLRVRLTETFEATQLEEMTKDTVCHFMRGLLNGLAGRLLGCQDLVCDERACEARGDNACEYLMRPMFG